MGVLPSSGSGSQDSLQDHPSPFPRVIDLCVSRGSRASGDHVETRGDQDLGLASGVMHADVKKRTSVKLSWST